MPPRHTHIAKAATPEHLAWRERISQHEGAITAAFLAWIRELHLSLTDSEIAQAIITRSAAVLNQALQAITFSPALAPIAEAEADLAFEETVRQIDVELRVAFDVRNPNFVRAIEQQQAALVREVTDETRRAIANVINRAYQSGVRADVVAPEIRELVGLTSRQAQAVLNFAEAQRQRGLSPERVADRAIRYARRMRQRRALTIGRTETVRAMTAARIASYEQAAAAGLFDQGQAELRWSSVQTDPAEVCAQLDGQTVPLGGTFDGMLPPVHPCCRCSVSLVLPDTSDVVARMRQQYAALNASLGVPA